MIGGLPSGGEDEVVAPRPAVGLDPLAGQGPTLAVIAGGGALGSLARYGVELAVAPGPDGFPLATFLVNVVGCLLIGGVVVTATELRAAGWWVRPFLATGVLGGFTTFSTYAVDAQELLGAGRVLTAGTYLAGTLATAVAATWLGIRLTRAVAGTRR